MSDESVVECPKCGAEARRLISGGAGLLFKGSGFYITDYRSDSYKKAQEKESTTGAKEAKEPKKGSESKKASEPKSESKKESK